MSENVPSTPVSTATFRDLSDAISPTWLKGPVGTAYRYSMHIEYDGLYDAFTYALRSRFPELAPTDALPWLALDRLIIRGPNEPDASYVQRLIQWLDLWRHAGSSTGILLGVLGYLSPHVPKVLTVQSSALGAVSSWDTYTAGADPFPPGTSNPTPPDHFVHVPANWEWDGLTPPYYYPWMRWRKWVVIFSTGVEAPWPAPTQVWDDGSRWDDGHCWDFAGTADEGIGLHSVVAQWQSASVWVPWILIAYDASRFDETKAFGDASLPDSTWGRWGKKVADATYGSVYEPARPTGIAGVAFASGPAQDQEAW